jgi:hypothetical protein
MKKSIYIFFGVAMCLGFLSCNCKTQYGVYVKNDTLENLTLSFKSNIDEKGPIEETLILAPGDYKRIIWTQDLQFEEDCSGTTTNHCKYVAEYVKAYIRDSIPSNLNWCDEKIHFEKTDIGQAEFTINYTPSDFDLE